MNNRLTLALIHDGTDEYGRRYYQSHKDWKKKYNAAYYANHKDYWKEYYRNRVGVKSAGDSLQSMYFYSDPQKRRKELQDANDAFNASRSDKLREYYNDLGNKRFQAFDIENDVVSMHKVLSDANRARMKQEAIRSAKSGQAASGASVPFSGKGQDLKYVIKDAVSKFGKNWKSGAKDIISTGKSIVSGLRSKLGF